MTEKDRRRENRHISNQEIDIYLSHDPGGAAISPLYRGQLVSLSRAGACIALDEVMSGSTHLAFGPMESDTLQLNIIFSFLDSEESLTITARPIWLDKKQSENVPPFHIGIEFAVPLSVELLQQLNRQPR